MVNLNYNQDQSKKSVGLPLGKVTKVGRPVYYTPEGEKVSERSRTITLDNGKVVNVPSIHGGKEYDEISLKKAIEDNRLIPTSEHKSIEEAEKAAIERSNKLQDTKSISTNPLPDFYMGYAIDAQTKAQELGEASKAENLRYKDLIAQDINPIRQAQYQAALKISPNDYTGAYQAVFGTEMSPLGGVTIGYDAIDEYKKGNYGIATLFAAASGMTFFGAGPITKPLTTAVKTAKNKVNPLFTKKPKTQDVLISYVDNKPVYKTYTTKDVNANNPQTLVEFFSPYREAIENMSIAKDGTKGENIIAYVNKRSPNVTPDEKAWRSIESLVNPNKKYTKEEVLSLLNKDDDLYRVEFEASMPDDQGIYGSNVDFQNFQRMKDIGVDLTEKDYVELQLKSDGRLKITDDEHWGEDSNVIVHGRSSVQTFPDGKDRVFVEEMQSNPAEKAKNLAGEGVEEAGTVHFPVDNQETMGELPSTQVTDFFSGDAREFFKQFSYDAFEDAGVGQNFVPDYIFYDSVPVNKLFVSNNTASNLDLNNPYIDDDFINYLLPKRGDGISPSPMQWISNYYNRTLENAKKLGINRSSPLRFIDGELDSGLNLRNQVDQDKILESLDYHYDSKRINILKDTLKVELEPYVQEQTDLVKQIGGDRSKTSDVLRQIVLSDDSEDVISPNAIIQERNKTLNKILSTNSPQEITALTAKFLGYQSKISDILRLDVAVKTFNDYMVDTTTKLDTLKNTSALDTFNKYLDNTIIKGKHLNEYHVLATKHKGASDDYSFEMEFGSPDKFFNQVLNLHKVSKITSKQYEQDLKVLKESIDELYTDDMDFEEALAIVNTMPDENRAYNYKGTIDEVSIDPEQTIVNILKEYKPFIDQTADRISFPTVKEFESITKNIKDTLKISDTDAFQQIKMFGERGKIFADKYIQSITEKLDPFLNEINFNEYNAMAENRFSGTLQFLEPSLIRGGQTTFAGSALSPIVSKKEYIKKMLLANIAFAKKRNLKEIVIPEWEAFYKVREGEFNTSEESARRWTKSIYNDAVKKALNDLTTETQNAIKVGDIDIPIASSDFHYESPIKGTVVNIEDFIFDPTKDRLRFKQGGLVYNN